MNGDAPDSTNKFDTRADTGEGTLLSLFNRSFLARHKAEKGKRMWWRDAALGAKAHRAGQSTPKAFRKFFL